MKPIRFGIIGGGWRTDFFLRVAKALPERFDVAGVVFRTAAKAEAFEQKWGVPTYRTIDELLATGGVQFVVVAVKWAPTPVLLKELAERKIPALSETPPAPDVPGLIAVCETARKARIQVAEQYQFQPLHAARLALVRSGKLGTVTQAQISIAHAYHGVSLLRLLLGVGFDEAEITARTAVCPVLAGPNRAGGPTEEKLLEDKQTIAWLDFGEKLGVHDFGGAQYFSWIRSPRFLVRGEKGEINDREVRLLHDFRTPAHYELVRRDAGDDGNLEGYFHKGITAGEEWLYRNPFVPARLADDELAVADCLARMAEYADGGDSFYSVAEAAQDHYLGMLINQAAESGERVRAVRQPWAE